ncbi:tetraspanin-1-like isoform X2 [Ornithorhynchus anatinus]|uniref:tetraspanin-1-like isoform X2 n=1 Tax=Ornithorhynchus anatinus TaxID=9258 RepID=UPI0010A7DB16|nr:tetraspanin-1-like isoform X2 [Ornithorhynchus anatinus]
MALMQDYGQLQPGAKMGGFSWIKILMVISSLTLYLAGGALLGEGFWVSVDRVKVGSVLIAVGWVLILLSVLGCCAALKESRQLLLMPEPPNSHRSRSLIQKGYGSQEAFTQAWNNTMEMLCCCGIDGYADFEDSPFYNMAKVYPPYCCRNTTIRCIGAAASVDPIQGCFMWERWTSATVVRGVMAGIGTLEVIAMGLALYFFGKLDTT